MYMKSTSTDAIVKTYPNFAAIKQITSLKNRENHVSEKSKAKNENDNMLFLLIMLTLLLDSDSNSLLLPIITAAMI